MICRTFKAVVPNRSPTSPAVIPRRRSHDISLENPEMGCLKSDDASDSVIWQAPTFRIYPINARRTRCRHDSLIGATEDFCSPAAILRIAKEANMGQLLRATPMPELAAENRAKLQPFISAFDQTILARARKAGFRKSSKRTLMSLTKMINTILIETTGHPMDLAIVLFAFRRCGQAYFAAMKDNGPRRQQFHLIDCLWRLTVELEHFHELDALISLTRAL
jgi:hypothetical protein